jgi:hypothetical protein
MEEKMQALYSELGLVQNTNDKKAWASWCVVYVPSIFNKIRL